MESSRYTLRMVNVLHFICEALDVMEEQLYCLTHKLGLSKTERKQANERTP